jgi:PEP-CTERM motif
MKKTILSLVTLLTLTLTLNISAQASLLSLDVNGTFGPATTLDGTSLNLKPFTYHAVFDSTGFQGTSQFESGYVLSKLTFDFNSQTYTMASGTPDIYTYFADGNGTIAGLLNANMDKYFASAFLYPQYGEWNHAALVPMTFSGRLFDFASDSLTVPLAGGHTLANLSWDSDSPTTAALTASTPSASAVPEPSTYAFFSLGLGGLVFWNRRQKKA